MKASTLILCCLLALGGCAPVASTIKPALDEEGELFVYLQPFPREAERLAFTLDRLSALRSDGAEFPLALLMTELQSSTAGRQRFLASGRLPAGQYRGLTFVVKKAALRGEEGEAALLVPGEPGKTEFEFEIQRRKAATLAFQLRSSESLQSGFSFTPAFSLSIPQKPVIGLVGLVTNRNDNTVAVFDKKSGQVASIIATGRGPEGAALDQKTGRAYVALSGDDAIEVIDVLALRPVNRIAVTPGDRPGELALTPDGRTLVALYTASNTLGIIDPFSLIELDRIRVGDGPRSLLVDRAGRLCYVFNSFSNTISIIDIAKRTLVGTLSTEPGPLRGQFNRKGDRLYVIHEQGPYLTVIDATSLSVIQRVLVGPALSALKVDVMTDMLYTCRTQDPRIEVYDPFSLLPVDMIRVPAGGEYMTIDGEENNLYLLSAESRMLTAVNLMSNKIVSETDLGEFPFQVTMMGER